MFVRLLHLEVESGKINYTYGHICEASHSPAAARLERRFHGDRESLPRNFYQSRHFQPSNTTGDMTSEKDSGIVYLYTDGAAKGNPGPAALGVVLTDVHKTPIEECAEYIGSATNNVAEYRALLRGLELALQRNVKTLRVRSDSELLVRQINGIYRVKNPGLKPLFDQVKEQLSKFPQWEVRHVPREQNSLADGLANRAIHQYRRGQGAGNREQEIK